MISEKKITFSRLVKAMNKKWLAVSIMLLLFGITVSPESASYNQPLTLWILREWLISIGATIIGIWVLFSKVALEADFNALDDAEVSGNSSGPKIG